MENFEIVIRMWYKPFKRNILKQAHQDGIDKFEGMVKQDLVQVGMGTCVPKKGCFKFLHGSGPCVELYWETATKSSVCLAILLIYLGLAVGGGSRVEQDRERERLKA
jgi:hypothetical protein